MMLMFDALKKAGLEVNEDLIGFRSLEEVKLPFYGSEGYQIYGCENALDLANKAKRELKIGFDMKDFCIADGIWKDYILKNTGRLACRSSYDTTGLSFYFEYDERTGGIQLLCRDALHYGVTSNPLMKFVKRKRILVHQITPELFDEFLKQNKAEDCMLPIFTIKGNGIGLSLWDRCTKSFTGPSYIGAYIFKYGQDLLKDWFEEGNTLNKSVFYRVALNRKTGKYYCKRNLDRSPRKEGV